MVALNPGLSILTLCAHDKSMKLSEASLISVQVKQLYFMNY